MKAGLMKNIVGKLNKVSPKTRPIEAGMIVGQMSLGQLSVGEVS
jgi:hypothetical protein